MNSNQTALPEETLAYIESIGLYGSEFGMPRSAARVMGLLLISSPAHQSTDEIRQKLSLSAGAVSGAVTMLQATGLIRQIAIPNDRRSYYEIDSGAWRRAIHTKLRAIAKGAQIAEDGLKISPNNTRLREMYEVYNVIQKEIKRILNKMEENTDDQK